MENPIGQPPPIAPLPEISAVAKSGIFAGKLIFIIPAAVVVIGGATGYYFVSSPENPVKQTAVETARPVAEMPISAAKTVGATKASFDLEACFDKCDKKKFNTGGISMTQEEQEGLNEMGKFGNQMCKSDCYSKLAKSASNVEDCQAIFDLKKSTWSLCMDLLAEKKSDTSICDQAKEIDFSFFHGSCLRKIAIKVQDISICKKIEESVAASQCVYAIAEKLKDPELCMEIVNNDEPRLSVKSTVSIRNQCFEDAARWVHDSSLCEKLDLEPYPSSVQENIMKGCKAGAALK